MVPKQKNNQRIPSGYFSFAEYQKCCEVIKELESSGSTVLLTAMKPALAAYYVSLISNKVVNRGQRDAVIVRKMPRDKDQIIEALNQKLNDKPSSSLSESESFRANEVWLYESLNGLSVPNIVFAARTVRQLALAGVSLLVSINGQQSGGMKEIIHSCKSRRWDFDSPTLEEAEMHHLQTVRRLRSGSHLTATDGRGSWSIFRFDKSILTPVNDKAFCEGPKVASEIYISITKSGKPELVTQKLTELGVGSISFFFSERSVPKWDAHKIEKNHNKLLKVSRLALALSLIHI